MKLESNIRHSNVGFSLGIDNKDYRHKQSTFSFAREIYREEGWRGLTRGITPRVVKVAPACAIMISSYELGKMYFDSVRR